MKAGRIGTHLEISEGVTDDRPGLGGGPGTGGRGGRFDDDHSSDEFDPTAPNAAKSRLLAMFLIGAVTMTFGGLIAAYVVIATNKAIEWKPFDLPLQVWFSTIVIALSSGAYALAERNVWANKFMEAKRDLLVTAGLGAIFISSQLILWFELSARGIYAYGNPYAGFFYIMTALHAAHVGGGIIALGSVILRSWKLPQNESGIERRQTLTQIVGWYWHLMGALWVVLVGLLGFWH